MEIETYEVEEIKGDAGEMAADSEALELAQSMGLTGQLSLTDTKTVTRNPFRLITNEERAVYRTVFPQLAKVEDYWDGVIPLRVLQLIQKAKECGMFSTFYVWHPESRMADPVLVGIVKRQATSGTYSWEVEDTYLLARWGTSLLPFEELKDKARLMLIPRFRRKLMKIQTEVKTSLDTLDDAVDVMLNGGDSKTDPHFSF